MENLNLIRKIAWSYHHTTGVELDDLIQEASLAYIEAMRKYDPERGKISTFVWHTINNHLRNYLKKELEWRGLSTELDGVDQTYTQTHWSESLSEDAIHVAQLLFWSPRTMRTLSVRSVRKQLFLYMTKKKRWSTKRVNQAFRDLRMVFN